jgi:hypothetical protein
VVDLRGGELEAVAFVEEDVEGVHRGRE